MPLKKKELEKFKEILLAEKKKILKHLRELSESSEEELNTSPSGDSADLASFEMNQASLSKIGKREAKLLNKINYSLDKIEDGTYGICEECGEDIGVKRLEARPVALLCIDCKTAQENKEKRFKQRDLDEEEDSGLSINYSSVSSSDD